MKKMILIAVLIAVAFAAAGIVGVVFAQDDTPPFTGHGPMLDGQGVLHTYMVAVFAEKLDLNVDDINARLAAGERMVDIALSAGVAVEEFPAFMTEVRSAALDAAVADGVITQEQADWMKSRGSGHGGMGAGDCDGTGPQGHGGFGHGGMMRGQQYQQVNP